MKPFIIPGYRDLVVTKAIGGLRPLWHARHPAFRIVGAGSSGELAIKDWQAQYRRIARDNELANWRRDDSVVMMFA